MTTTPEDPHSACRERLSALMDGELSGPVLHQACGHWREASESRAAWHVYHVIGDVLRSDDLAGGAERSAAFLDTLRGRMANEPVVLAPWPLGRAPAPALPVGLQRPVWRRASTYAAGAVAVAGVVLLARAPFDLGSTSAGVRLATSTSRPLAFASPLDGEATALSLGTGTNAPPLGARTTAAPGSVGTTAPPTGTAESTSPSSEPRAVAPGDPLIRDARLDRYLEAHQQFVGSSAFGMPSGFLRAATSESVHR